MHAVYRSLEITIGVETFYCCAKISFDSSPHLFSLLFIRFWLRSRQAKQLYQFWQQISMHRNKASSYWGSLFLMEIFLPVHHYRKTLHLHYWYCASDTPDTIRSMATTPLQNRYHHLPVHSGLHYKRSLPYPPYPFVHARQHRPCCNDWTGNGFIIRVHISCKPAIGIHRRLVGNFISQESKNGLMYSAWSLAQIAA